jgi:drug/metabolite transporter superfamily protein YnfA
LSLAYLAVAGTVVAFGGFLTLQQRLGPGKAATVGVMTPVVALAVSTALEGYRPDAYTAAGAALAILGNVLMLRRDAVRAADELGLARDRREALSRPVVGGLHQALLAAGHEVPPHVAVAQRVAADQHHAGASPSADSMGSSPGASTTR